MNCILLAQLNIDKSIDSIEFCTLKGFENVIAIGTYKLDDQPTSINQTRQGGFHICNYDSDHQKICTLAIYEGSGILDLKWIDCNEGILACAHSDGIISLNEVNLDKKVEIISHNYLINEECLVLAISLGSKSKKLVASSSNGNIIFCDLHVNNSTKIKPTDKWQGHDYEAWTVSFDILDSNKVFSG
ncbi:unnamed protein product [Gordionus sp. m RMFG-2023]